HLRQARGGATVALAHDELSRPRARLHPLRLHGGRFPRAPSARLPAASRSRTDAARRGRGALGVRRALFSLALFGLLACSSKKGDPPPPVGSGTLPIAPPGATGALAAGREETAARPGLTPPEDS